MEYITRDPEPGAPEGAPPPGEGPSGARPGPWQRLPPDAQAALVVFGITFLADVLSFTTAGVGLILSGPGLVVVYLSHGWLVQRLQRRSELHRDVSLIRLTMRSVLWARIGVFVGNFVILATMAGLTLGVALAFLPMAVVYAGGQIAAHVLLALFGAWLATRYSGKQLLARLAAIGCGCALLLGGTLFVAGYTLYRLIEPWLPKLTGG